MTEQTTNQARAGLYKKIAAVTAAVNRIPKNGFNNFFKYKYATESDITDGLRELLNAHGLAFLPPSVLAWERNTTIKKDGNPGDDLTRVQIQFEIACTDTGEVYTSQMWGEGQDSGDKGLYKAYTGAVKYYLMKTFLIATGDDPKQDHPQQQRAPASYAPAPEQRQQRPPAPQPKQAAAAPTHSSTGAPLCDVCGTPAKEGKWGPYCPAKENHGGKFYTIKPKTAPVDTAEWDDIDSAPSVQRRRQPEESVL